jgi:hypothetical protein
MQMEKVTLPMLTNQRMNGYLKEIADLCTITKVLTYHLARHTFATTITLSNGVPIETVLGISANVYERFASMLTPCFAPNWFFPNFGGFYDKSGCYSLRNNKSYQTDFLTN